jgi:hypothetical protein
MRTVVPYSALVTKQAGVNRFAESNIEPAAIPSRHAAQEVMPELAQPSALASDHRPVAR